MSTNKHGLKEAFQVKSQILWPMQSYTKNWQGRNDHCQIVHMGFDSYLHIANVLTSVYCKCANLEDALYIFVNTGGKDIVSWNSMIAGYARHGLAVQGIGLFERMKNQGVKPDAILFLVFHLHVGMQVLLSEERITSIRWLYMA
jgi:pentatricopeptide repeat protein